MIEPSDGPESPHVAVISESLARSKWPGQDPIGRFVQFGNMDGDLKGFQVVGIVGDVRELTPETPPSPLLYASYRQRPNSIWRFSVVLRGPDPDVIGPSVQRAVREVAPEIPVQLRTMQGAFSTALTGRRFSLVLITVFGGTALLLATFGLYGLISYLVAQRTREIGIRMALGAKSADLLKLIVGKGARLALYGTSRGPRRRVLALERRAGTSVRDQSDRSAGARWGGGRHDSGVSDGKLCAGEESDKNSTGE